MSRFSRKLAVASVLGTLLGVGFGRPALAQTAGLTVRDGKMEAPRYYGLHFDLSVYDGSGLNSVGQNYRNDLSFYFEPSWDIGHTFSNLRNTRWAGLQLAVRFVVSANLSGTDDAGFSGNTQSGPQGTCSNLSPSANGGVIDPTQVGYCNPQSATRRADYSDLWVTLRVPGLYKWKNQEYSFSVNPGIRAVLPTSAESRFNTLIMGVTPTLSLSNTFWKHRLRAGYTFGITKNFHQHAQQTYSGDSPGNAGTLGGNPYDGPLSAGLSNFYADPSRQGPFGGLNTNFALLNIVSGGVNFNDKWSFDALYIVSTAWAYGQDCTLTVQGVTTDLCANGQAVAANSGSSITPAGGRRDNQTLWLSLNYQPWDWMGFSVSWINSAPMWKPDSTYRQGFISTDYNAFTTVSFGASISIDHVAEAIENRTKKKAAPVAQGNGVSLQ